MIRSPNTAEGRTLPKYCMYFGVGLSAGKIIKGKKRVIIVPRTTIEIVIICCVNVIIFPPFQKDFSEMLRSPILQALTV